MEDALPGALPRGFPGYPHLDAKLLEELESLRKENLLYAEKLIKANSDSAALWEQVAQLKRLLVENRIPFAARLAITANGRPFAAPNGSRRNSIEARSPDVSTTRSDRNSPRRDSSSSRESRLSVASSSAEGVEKAEESPPRRRSHGPSNDESKSLPPIKPRLPKQLSISRAELATIGESSPNGSLHGGGSPSRDSPPGRSKMTRASEGYASGRGGFGGAYDRGGFSGRFGRFPIRGSAKIHPFGGDEEMSSSRELVVSFGGLLSERMPRGGESPSGRMAGGVGSPTGRMTGGAPTRAKLDFKELWQTAGWAVVRGKAKPAKPLADWGIVLDKVKEKQGHWSSILTRPISGDGIFRRNWDTLLMVCFLYIVSFVPYMAAFNISQSWRKNPSLFVINWFLDVVFTVDIVVNFRSTYTTTRGKVVGNSKEIAVHYLKTWFVLDALSVVPLPIMIPTENGTSHGLQFLPFVLKMLRLNKLIKLIRFRRLRSTFEALENHVPHGVLSILKFLCFMFVIGHFTACAFYYGAVFDNLGPDSWPMKEGIVHHSNFSKYIICLYWAFSTLCTVGYGDVVATTTIERTIAIGAMILGATLFAYLMGNMSLLVANLDQDATRQERQMDSVNSFLRSRHIPKDLQTRVRDYYRYLWRHQVHSEENTIITGLNASLRTDVVLYMYREMLEKVPFFHGKPPQFISALVLCLRPEFFGPGDFIMREHDIGKDMYFIIEGLVHVLSARIGTIVKKPGEYFGEMALVTGQRRSASCTAQTYCELYSLSKENLDQVLQDWPELKQEFYAQGRARVAEAGLDLGQYSAAAYGAAGEELAQKALTEPGFEAEERAEERASQ